MSGDQRRRLRAGCGGSARSRPARLLRGRGGRRADASAEHRGVCRLGAGAARPRRRRRGGPVGRAVRLAAVHAAPRGAGRVPAAGPPGRRGGDGACRRHSRHRDVPVNDRDRDPGERRGGGAGSDTLVPALLLQGPRRHRGAPGRGRRERLRGDRADRRRAVRGVGASGTSAPGSPPTSPRRPSRRRSARIGRSPRRSCSRSSTRRSTGTRSRRSAGAASSRSC